METSQVWLSRNDVKLAPRRLQVARRFRIYGAELWCVCCEAPAGFLARGRLMYLFFIRVIDAFLTSKTCFSITIAIGSE